MTDIAPAAPETVLAEVAVYVNQALIAHYSIAEGEYILGRDPTCHILVDADQVSRHHARLTLSGFELIIEDVGSSNGIFVDGVQVQIPTRIRLDQEIQMGSARLRIGLKEAASRRFAEALWDKDLGLESVKQLLEEKKYRLLTTLARGGMGVIMQARDVRIRRTVAMKLMKTGSQFSRENVLRFIDEAQLTGQLEHPNIVPVYELGLDEHGETFYTMKYVKGITLDEVLRALRKDNPKTLAAYPLATLITIFQKICDGVAFAHSNGVVHRDLKPQNIMIGSFGEVLVMDWGLAKNLTEAARSTPVAGSGYEPIAPGRGFQTLNGLIVGTPPYISPEQARGELEHIDTRSDVFVLGEILYAILTLRVPVAGESLEEVVENLLGGKIVAPSSFNQPVKKSRKMPINSDQERFELTHCPGRRIPEGLSAVVMKAMHLEPDLRYQSVVEMQADITAWQDGFPTKAERAGFRKHVAHFIGRHKGEVALLGVAVAVFNVVVLGFVLELAAEKNRALESRNLAGELLAKLRGTAPIYFEEAGKLLAEGSAAQALGRIEYAIEQVPNDAEYHNLRGNILQVLQRWEDSVAAYEDVLERNPKHAAAKLNLAFSQHMLEEFTREGTLTPGMASQIKSTFAKQRRTRELAKTGLISTPEPDPAASKPRPPSWIFRENADGSQDIDLSRTPHPNLQRLRPRIGGVNLDDTLVEDLAMLKGLKLQALSLNRTQVKDLGPLAGLPLKRLSVASTKITDLSALAGAPLRTLDISNTPVTSLEPLRGMALVGFSAANCPELSNLEPLSGQPLERVNLSRTAISDLGALLKSPVRELNLEGCSKLLDVTALLKITTLKSVILPAQCKDVAFLKKHPSLKDISYKAPAELSVDGGGAPLPRR